MTMPIEQRTTALPRGFLSKLRFMICAQYKEWRAQQMARTELEALEALGPDVLDDIGITQVMYASDYRHWDSEFPDSVKEVNKIPGMTEDKLRHVLGENARNWFNLKDDDLPAR